MAAKPVDWTFGGLWPYAPRWFDTPDGRLHYVDEGPRDGRPVVLLHGNPTWGFLYRNFIGPLTATGHRVIVPDHLGFGRSDKPGAAEHYRIAAHARRLDQLLESLDLHDAVVVPQDWGGPIGLAWAVTHPERIAGLVILNTAAHVPREPFQIPLPLKLFRAPLIGPVMVQGLGLFHRAFLFGVGVSKKDRLTPAVKRAYLTPHRGWSSRKGVLVFPREIPVLPTDEPWATFAGSLEDGMARDLDRIPVKLIWGMKDPSFGPELIDTMWLNTFPEAEVVRIADASHYLQEDAHEVIVPELLAFLAGLKSRSIVQ